MSEGRKVVLDMPEAHDPLARLAQEERQRQGDRHPRAEQLTAYHAGELAADEAERLQSHLAVCSICTRALLDLPVFYLEGQTPVLRASSEDLETPSPAQTEASWRAVRGKLAAWDRRLSAPPDAQPFPADQERRRHPRFITSPAAFLGMALSLLSSLIFSAWIVIGQPELAQKELVYMSLAAVTRGSGDEQGLDIAPPGRHGSLTFVCRVPAPTLPSYKVEIRVPGGKGPLVSAEAFPQAGPAAREPSVTVTFSGERLAPGDYRLVVSSPRGEPLGEWYLHIHAPG